MKSSMEPQRPSRLRDKEGKEGEGDEFGLGKRLSICRGLGSAYENARCLHKKRGGLQPAQDPEIVMYPKESPFCRLVSFL